MTVSDQVLRGGGVGLGDWPEHVGVEGINAWAAGALDHPVSASRAIAAIDEWLHDADGGVPGGDTFPYAYVLAHYRAVGRTHADPALVEWLRSLAARAGEPAPGGGERAWPLPEWLPSTVDQETGDYDSYLGSALLESLTDDQGPEAGETDRTTDALIGALAADLARIEAEALQLAPSALQLQRTRSCLVVLSRLGELSPRWSGRPALHTDPIGRSDHRSDARRLADATGRLAAEVLERAPRRCRLAVGLSLLPTTPLHDELMFVRSIQIFETLYRQVYRCLVRANAAMRAADVDRACAELADANSRLELSPVLYRVVTTMPREAFAVIREYTHGRSAIQSRAYRRIHHVCAPQPASPVADKLPRVDVDAPTLQETFLAVADRLGASGVDRIAARMRALDETWRAMKRTHWGVTLKTIGKVPGTGGTTGADYLKQAAEVPLFPALAAP